MHEPAPENVVQRGHVNQHPGTGRIHRCGAQIVGAGRGSRDEDDLVFEQGGIKGGRLPLLNLQVGLEDGPG